MLPLETTLQMSAAVLGAYLIGALPFGFLIGKIVAGIDIRTQGSGNIGATNVTRVVGPWWGRLCFLLDFVKGALPVAAVTMLITHNYLPNPLGALPSMTALSAVCGHIFPVYLGFKGGKGVSTAAGAAVALNPPALLAAGLVWVILFLTSRYVSLASIFAAASLPAFCFLFQAFPGFVVWRSSIAEFSLFCLLAAMTILKHRSNIKRLLNGTENRFVKNKENTTHESH